MTDVQIGRGDPLAADVVALLTEHLADMRRISPPESVHALEPSALASENTEFLTARRGGILLGCGAVQMLSGESAAGEIKSMRTAPAARGEGVGSAILAALIETARARGMTALFLETGSQDFFAPARRLYERHGFTRCGPFAEYTDDPNSAYFTRAIAD